MKWMGWSFQQLESCPADHVDLIVEMMVEEANAANR